jgi:chemotaxis protein methyltransferase CheR
VGLAPDIVAGVARRLAEHAGLKLPAWVVEARTQARIAALGTTPEAYVELIGAGRGQAELGALVEAVRVGESSLFRHKPQIAALLDVVVPAIRARGRRSLRVWSAGCASGEEPYTLAIVLSRALPEVSITVHATDVSAEALAMAEAGTYPVAELADVPEEYRDAFELVGNGDEIEVAGHVKRVVMFERANLLDGGAPKGCDIVWCRNVLIYFAPEARRRAIDRLIAATNPGGVIFVGYSESLRDIDELEARRAGDVVFYVRPGRPREDSGKTPIPTFAFDAKTPVPQVDRRTPLAVPVVKLPPEPASEQETLIVAGTPDPMQLTRELGERLAIGGLEKLVVDLDRAELLADELAPVLRRAQAAARAAHVELVLRTTRPGTRRWLSRHDLLDEEEAR